MLALTLSDSGLLEIAVKEEGHAFALGDLDYLGTVEPPEGVINAIEEIGEDHRLSRREFWQAELDTISAGSQAASRSVTAC